jgi:pimeloyl-ACP methyl ester carboxylesterase
MVNRNISGQWPLVLLPGLLCDEVLWAAQIAALQDIASITVGDLTGAETMDEVARQILAAAPPRFALAGLSMGGYCSFAIMRLAPERVTRLALLDTSARADTPEQARRRRDFIRLAERGKFQGLTPKLLPQWVHEEAMAKPELVATVTAMTQRVGRDAFIRQQKAILSRPDSTQDLAAIRVPTLVLCGRQDQATPLDRSREIAAGIADSRLVIVEDCGHLATLERPKEVSRAMRRWLEY